MNAILIIIKDNSICCTNETILNTIPNINDIKITTNNIVYNINKESENLFYDVYIYDGVIYNMDIFVQLSNINYIIPKDISNKNLKISEDIITIYSSNINTYSMTESKCYIHMFGDIFIFKNESIDIGIAIINNDIYNDAYNITNCYI